MKKKKKSKSFKEYLISEMDMGKKDANIFISGFEEIHYNKGDYILKEGSKNNIVRIILKGCARGFVLVVGICFSLLCLWHGLNNILEPS